MALSSCPQAHVYAFEPIPTGFDRLLASLAQEPRADLFSLALADHNGPLTFDFDPTNTGITPAVQGVHALVHGLKDTQSITALGRCLDDFCADQGIAGIDLLKIDVEGFKGNVLRGD